MALHRKLLFMDTLYPSQRKYRDLAKQFAKSENKKTKYHIRFGAKYPIDKVHAEQLKHFDNVYLYEYESGSHHMIKELKQSGELMQIIDSATSI